MTKWNTPEFKQLQKEWYQRLDDEGFQDAEVLIDGELVLQQRASNVYRGSPQIQRESKEAYFRLLGQLVHKAKFDRKIDKTVLMAYAAGDRITVIVRDLKKEGTPRNRTAVRFIIRKYKMRWGLEEYTNKQLGIHWK